MYAWLISIEIPYFNCRINLKILFNRSKLSLWRWQLTILEKYVLIPSHVKELCVRSKKSKIIGVSGSHVLMIAVIVAMTRLQVTFLAMKPDWETILNIEVKHVLIVAMLRLRSPSHYLVFTNWIAIQVDEFRTLVVHHVWPYRNFKTTRQCENLNYVEVFPIFDSKSARIMLQDIIKFPRSSLGRGPLDLILSVSFPVCVKKMLSGGT